MRVLLSILLAVFLGVTLISGCSDDPAYEPALVVEDEDDSLPNDLEEIAGGETASNQERLPQVVNVRFEDGDGVRPIIVYDTPEDVSNIAEYFLEYSVDDWATVILAIPVRLAPGTPMSTLIHLIKHLERDIPLGTYRARVSSLAHKNDPNWIDSLPVESANTHTIKESGDPVIINGTQLLEDGFLTFTGVQTTGFWHFIGYRDISGSTLREWQTILPDNPEAMQPQEWVLEVGGSVYVWAVLEVATENGDIITTLTPRSSLITIEE